MIGNHESTKRTGHLLGALLRLRKRVCGGKIQRACRCGIQTQLRSASDTSVCIAIPTETAEGICCRVDSAGETKETIERGAKAFKKRRRSVTVADMPTYFCT